MKDHLDTDRPLDERSDLESQVATLEKQLADLKSKLR